MTASKALLGTVLAFIVLALAAVVFQTSQPAFGGFSSTGSAACRTILQDEVAIGADSSVELVADASNYAYIRISQPINATNTVTLNLGGDVAATSSIYLSGADAASNTPDVFVAGLNTEFPYSGSIEAKTSVGSTTIGVVTCKY